MADLEGDLAFYVATAAFQLRDAGLEVSLFPYDGPSMPSTCTPPSDARRLRLYAHNAASAQGPIPVVSPDGGEQYAEISLVLDGGQVLEAVEGRVNLDERPAGWHGTFQANFAPGEPDAGQLSGEFWASPCTP